MNAIDSTLNDNKNIEVDIENNLFEIKTKTNKDLLKPKQCYCCLLLFTPENEDDNFCSDCKKKGFTMGDIKLAECQTEGCNNTFKKEHNAQRFCPSCRSKKFSEVKKRQYNRTQRPKREISIKDSPFEKLIKGTFFLFQDDIESVTFTMKDRSGFSIKGVNNG